VRNSVSVGGWHLSPPTKARTGPCGAQDSEHIANILVDPKDATLLRLPHGSSWDDNRNAAFYKTSDGQELEKSLAGRNASTGLQPCSP